MDRHDHQQARVAKADHNARICGQSHDSQVHSRAVVWHAIVVFEMH